MDIVTTISPPEAAQRLAKAGYPISETAIRLWCGQKGFGVRVMDRWRIPVERVDDMVKRLEDARASSCSASKS